MQEYLAEDEEFFDYYDTGEYVVELAAGDQVQRRGVTILQDYWYDK